MDERRQAIEDEVQCLFDPRVCRDGARIDLIVDYIMLLLNTERARSAAELAAATDAVARGCLCGDDDNAN